MSSIYIRDQIKSFLAANAPTETVIDLTGLYDEVNDVLEAAGITPDDPWLGIQFIGNDEVPITVGASNTSGKYRETGAVYFHIVDIAKLGVSNLILARAEALRNKIRGQKLGTMFVDSVTPVNFEAGAALRFEDGYMTGAFIISYTNDKDF